MNNIAIPHGPATSADVMKLVQTFREHDRMPRLEMARELWPITETSLLEAGFSIETEMPLMACTPDSFCPPSANDTDISFVNDREALLKYYHAANRAYADDPILPTEEGLSKTLSRIAADEVACAIAHLNGTCVSGAMRISFEGVSELAGVATVPEERRKGFAYAICARLVQDSFRLGSLVWLSSGNSTSTSVYERLGFRRFGTQINVSLSN